MFWERIPNFGTKWLRDLPLYVAVLWLLTAMCVGAFDFVAPVSFPEGAVMEEEQSGIR